MRRLLFLIILYGVLPSFETINGVIWSKMQKTFVPIFSISTYATVQQEHLRQSRALETYNFQLQNLSLTSFQEPYFLNFHDNNTKVSGLCGEIWTLLSESLNFTLQPVRVYVNGVGPPEKDHTYKDGLLGIMYRNESIAIPKIETFGPRLVALDFTIPFWINKHQLYIPSEVTHDNIWMVKIFSWKIWCIILTMHILLTICTFLTQNVLRNKDEYKNTPFNEHLFYNFGNLCNQGYIPKYLDGRSRILEVSLGLFCSVIYMAFGALLFIYLTKKISIPPFDSLNSLVTDTKYSIVGLKGSTEDISFKVLTDEPYAQARKEKRWVAVSTVEEMHKIACFPQKIKYAIYQGDDQYKVGKNIMCHLTQIGNATFPIWVASGIVRNFKYKRTIDIGILRLMEVGLMDVLKDRWLEKRITQDYNVKTLQPVEIRQVSLVIAVICCGAIIAFIIFIIEKIVFVYKLKQL